MNHWQRKEAGPAPRLMTGACNADEATGGHAAGPTPVGLPCANPTYATMRSHRTTVSRV